jgi:hypothetical protein
MPLSEQRDDFVVLTDSHVVSPSRQLMIKFGRFDLEMHGVQDVEVYFDQELRPDRLMMPESQSPYYIARSPGGVDEADPRRRRPAAKLADTRVKRRSVDRLHPTTAQ